jgi:Ca2+-binding RTX toxin-like protein
MAIVTVEGAHGQIVSLSFDTAANAALARKIAAALTDGVRNGSILPAVDTDGPPPPLAPGTTGEFVQTADGLTILPHGYKAFVDTASESVVFGSGDADESVLSSVGDMTFFATGGSGTVVAGGGNNRVVIPGNDKGNWSINTGNGADAIFAMGGGNDTISPGGGNNAISLGGGKNIIQSTGDDSVIAGSGSETIVAIGAAKDLIFGGSSHLFYVGTRSSATVFGGSGSDTFFGGAGPDVVHGGTGGSNFLVAGIGGATLFGAATAICWSRRAMSVRNYTPGLATRPSTVSSPPARIPCLAAVGQSRSSAAPTTPSWLAPDRPRSMRHWARTCSCSTTARPAAPR